MLDPALYLALALPFAVGLTGLLALVEEWLGLTSEEMVAIELKMRQTRHKQGEKQLTRESVCTKVI